MTAFAVNMSNIGTGSNSNVNISVDAWSTAEEREMLITTMVEKGPRGPAEGAPEGSRRRAGSGSRRCADPTRTTSGSG